ncbi:MAG TPA: hypothetical protein VF798_10625 [Burkholderiaceae bacterium]
MRTAFIFDTAVNFPTNSDIGTRMVPIIFAPERVATLPEPILQPLRQARMPPRKPQEPRLPAWTQQESRQATERLSAQLPE